MWRDSPFSLKLRTGSSARYGRLKQKLRSWPHSHRLSSSLEEEKRLIDIWRVIFTYTVALEYKYIFIYLCIHIRVCVYVYMDVLNHNNNWRYSAQSRFSGRNGTAMTVVTVRSTTKSLANHADAVPEFGSVSKCAKWNTEAGMRTGTNWKTLSFCLQWQNAIINYRNGSNTLLNPQIFKIIINTQKFLKLS